MENASGNNGLWSYVMNNSLYVSQIWIKTDRFIKTDRIKCNTKLGSLITFLMRKGYWLSDNHHRLLALGAGHVSMHFTHGLEICGNCSNYSSWSAKCRSDLLSVDILLHAWRILLSPCLALDTVVDRMFNFLGDFSAGEVNLCEAMLLMIRFSYSTIRIVWLVVLW